MSVLQKIQDFIRPPKFDLKYLISKYSLLLGITSLTYIFFWSYVGLYLIIPINIVTGLLMLLIVLFIKKDIVKPQIGFKILLVVGLLEIFLVSLLSWHHTCIILDWLMLVPMSAFLFMGGSKKTILWSMPCFLGFIIIPFSNNYLLENLMRFENFNLEHMRNVNIISMIFLFFEVMLISIEYANLRDINERNLQKRNQELEMVQSYKDQFFTNISHELKTPMNAIQGISELLTLSDMYSNNKELIDVLKTSSSHLLTVINDILDYSKIKDCKLILVNADYNLQELLRSTFNMLRYSAENKKLEYRLMLASEVPLMVVGDPQRLKQVIVNLLGNAIKFTHEGKVEMRCLMLLNQSKQLQLRVEIIDTGIGISNESIDKLFYSYVQANEQISIKYGVTGLGLNICKNLIEMQSGIIGCKSVEGKGSTFFIELPIKNQSK